MRGADLTTDELRELISKMIDEKFREFFEPDYGLEIRDEFIKALESSIESKERISFEEVRKKLGL